MTAAAAISLMVYLYTAHKINLPHWAYGGDISRRMATKTTLNYTSYFSAAPPARAYVRCRRSTAAAACRCAPPECRPGQYVRRSTRWLLSEAPPTCAALVQKKAGLRSGRFWFGGSVRG